jgi:hypothetical protein
MRRVATLVLALLLPLALLPACYRVQTLRRQAAKLDRFVEIVGTVERPEGAEGPLVVELLRVARTHRGMDAIVERAVLAEPGRFRFVVRPSSRYALVAYVDTDRDLHLDAGERWTTPLAITANAGERSPSTTLLPDVVAEMPRHDVLV